MDRQRVSSGAISSVGYSEESAALDVEFKDGQVWRYSPVDRATYLQLLESKSVGEYFNRQIRDSARLRVRIA
jgi:hypothetical protein